MPELSPRYRFAALDYGTVTSRLLVADVLAGRLRTVLKQTRITQLGEGLAATGHLSSAACARVVAASRDFLAELERISARRQPGDPPISVCRAVATSAMRDAENSADLLAELSNLGIDVQVIAGEQEAALSFSGTLSGFNPAELAGRIVLVADIGGGSTELVAGSLDAGTGAVCIEQKTSLNIGARRITDRWLLTDPPSAAELTAARQAIRTELQPWFSQAAASGLSCQRIIGVAGTATSLISIREGMMVYDSERVHGSEATVAEIEGTLDDLAALPLNQRQQVVGLEAERASVVVGGLLILAEIMGLVKLPVLTVSETDILQGLILDSWQQLISK